MQALGHFDLLGPGPPQSAAKKHGGEASLSLSVDVHKRVHSPTPGSLCTELSAIKKVKREAVAREEGRDEKGISQRVNM